MRAAIAVTASRRRRWPAGALVTRPPSARCSAPARARHRRRTAPPSTRAAVDGAQSAPPIAVPPGTAARRRQPADRGARRLRRGRRDAAEAPRWRRGRDPFRPFTLDLRPETHESEILTPLQRYELPQLRLAGVVLELSPPRAMLQDNSGMGYIVTPGTPIGRRRGVVKAIESRRVVVEEHVIDYYGREQTHQVVIEMAKDDKPQSTVQE